MLRLLLNIVYVAIFTIVIYAAYSGFTAEKTFMNKLGLVFFFVTIFLFIKEIIIYKYRRYNRKKEHIPNINDDKIQVIIAKKETTSEILHAISNKWLSIMIGIIFIVIGILPTNVPQIIIKQLHYEYPSSFTKGLSANFLQIFFIIIGLAFLASSVFGILSKRK